VNGESFGRSCQLSGFQTNHAAVITRLFDRVARDKGVARSSISPAISPADQARTYPVTATPYGPDAPLMKLLFTFVPSMLARPIVVPLPLAQLAQ
jgi:hypothetical protein